MVERILMSVLARVIGLQFWMRVLSSSFFGIRIVCVLDHDKGGGSPFAILLKILHKTWAKGVMKVLYSSYGIPSGPGELPLSFDPMAVSTSCTVKGFDSSSFVFSEMVGM